jgi:hypothetical protein
MSVGGFIKMYEEQVAQARMQAGNYSTGMNGKAVGLREAGLRDAESLASIAPRVLNLADQAQDYVHRLENSFGIGTPEKSAQVMNAVSLPLNLMSQLNRMEQSLTDVCYTLERILQHVNG